MAMTFVPVHKPAPPVEAVAVAVGPGWFKQKLVRPFSRKSTIRKLARIFDIAKDHQANGVPAGHALYKTLYQQALEVAAEYSAEWQLDQATLFAQIPSLPQLRKLADPAVEQAGSKGGIAVLGIIGIVAVPLIIGAWSGLFSVGYRFILHHFGG